MNNFKNFKELPKDYVERGTILKSDEIVFDSCNKETPNFISFITPFTNRYIDLNTDVSNIKIIASYLSLEPDAKIKYHFHENDSEFYIIFYDDGTIQVDYCQKGEWHELENNTDEVLYVLSVKLVDSK